jgi:undecaprenyl-diphosphatase
MDLWYCVTLAGQPEVWMASTLVAALIYAYLRKGLGTESRKRAKAVVLIYIIGIWLSLSLVFILKNAVQTERPCIPCNSLAENCNPYCGTDNSFPSGHAAAIFAAFTALYAGTRKKWLIPLFILPVLVSYSRYALGVHYASDIIAGAVIGIAGPCVAFLLVRQYDMNKKPK